MDVSKLKPGNLPHHEADLEYLNLTENDSEAVDNLANPHSWSNCLGSTFKTRIGPDYKTHGLKDQSDEALYEVYALSMYKTKKKLPHFSRFIDFEASESSKSSPCGSSKKSSADCAEVGELLLDLDEKSIDDGANNLADDLHHGVENRKLSGDGQPSAADSEEDSAEEIPEIFVVNCMVPEYAPSAIFPKEDGKGYNLVVHLRMKASTKEKLKRKNPGPAIRLLKRFILCKPHPDDPEFDPENPLIRKKFKVITRIMNLNKTGFNRVTKYSVQQYNAKPFLARTSSSFYSGKDYFETDIDLHKFSYSAKLGLYGMKDFIDSVVFDFGFVIQAEDNDELPEQMLACCRVSKVSVSGVEGFPGEVYEKYS